MTQNKVSTRLAFIEDVPSLCELMSVLGYPTTKEEMQDRFTVLDKDPCYRMFVADIDGKVVGMAGALKSYYFEKVGCYVRLGALVTLETHRGKGIGRTLVQAVEAWGASVGASSLVLNCGNREEREVAHLFYKHLGYEAKSTGYAKKI